MSLLLTGAGGPASGFTPASLNPAAWYDAHTGPEWQLAARTTPAVVDADPVGAWDDASANARHALQSTNLSFRPSLRLAVQNGRSVVRFDGIDDSLNVPSLPASSYTVYRVFRVRSLPGVGGLAISGNQAAGAYLYMGIENAGGTIRSYNVVGTGQGLAYAYPFVAGGVYLSVLHGTDAGTWKHRINGVQNGSVAALAFANPLSVYRLGGGAIGQGLYCPWDFCAEIIYPAAHTLLQLEQVEGYLNARWGVY